MASRWSAVSCQGNDASNSRCQSESSAKSWPAAAAALGVEIEQLAGQLLRGAPGAGLERLPRLAAQLGEGRVRAPRPHIAADLGQLVDRHEDLVRAGELELEVVARDAGDRLGVEAGEAGEAVVLVDDDVAGAQVGERAQGAAPGTALRVRARRGGGGTGGARG